MDMIRVSYRQILGEQQEQFTVIAEPTECYRIAREMYPEGAFVCDAWDIAPENALDRTNDGIEADLFCFFGNFPNGASCGCAGELTPVAAFIALFPKLKAPHFVFSRDLEGVATNDQSGDEPGGTNDLN